MATIYYFGTSNPNSTTAHRAEALKRLGHTVAIFDPFVVVNDQLSNKIFAKLHYTTGYQFLEKYVMEWLSSLLYAVRKPDLIWIDSGELFTADSLAIIQKWKSPIILYNNDDPTGKRDGNRFQALLKTIPLYDLVVVVRPETELECRALGAKRVLHTFRSYDEVAHKPFDSTNCIPEQFQTDVAFIGTWIPNENRDEFLAELGHQGIPLSIWGDRWQKSPSWKHIQPFYKGEALGGREYVAAIQGAKICLGFLSAGNRDQHTQRSLEIPYAGGLFCAQRTNEHSSLYKEGQEAVFWNSAQECAQVCADLLTNDAKRETIRSAGKKRVSELKLGNENVCKQIVDLV